jgi:hypothetical protein
MKSLDIFIEEHYKIDKTRNSFSNLIKKIKLENEFFNLIDNYIYFGNFKQKLYHFIKKIPEKIYCPVCKNKELNWIESSNSYRITCSINCAGKLTGTKNNPKRKPHPDLNTKKEFISYFSNNKIRLVENNLIKIYPNLVKLVNNEIRFYSNNFSEKVYCYLYDLKSRPMCKHCNYNTVSFDTFTKGYHEFCSVKCSSNSVEKKNKIKTTCIKKYGVENIGLITRDKALDTMKSKYGGHISTTTSFKEKYRKTSIEKYGTTHPFKNRNIINKIQTTCVKKYGSSNPMKNDKVKDKNIQTKKDKGTIFKWTKTELKDIQSYRRSVSYYTEKTYNEYKYLINPNNLERGIDKYHIDHIYPVIEGWKNKIPPIHIANYKNIRLITSYDNLVKGDRTEISYEEFIKNITI